MTDAHPPPAAPGIGSAAPDTTFFFVVALSLCWLALAPASLAVLGVLPGGPDPYMAAAPLAVFSPTIAAVLASRREAGRSAIRALFAGLRAWRFGALWLVLAVTLPGLLYAAGRALYGLAPGAEDLRWIFPPESGQQVAALFVVPIAEEIGWRGYALPRLIARHGARRATAILSLFWSLWHVPMFVAVGDAPVVVLLSLGFIAIGNVSFTWMYRRGGGSLLLAVLFHFGAHLDSPTHALPAESTPLTIQTIGFAVLAVAVLALDRRAWEGATPEAPGTPNAGGPSATERPGDA